MHKKYYLTTVLSIDIVGLSATAQNKLPSSGKVGVGTMTPHAELEVVGETQLDGFTTVKDSMLIEKKLMVEENIEIVGATLMRDNVKAKSDLKIMGMTKMKGDAFVEGDFTFRSLEDPTTAADRFLMITKDGKTTSLDKAGVVDLMYQPKACLVLPNGNNPAPIWSNTEGVNQTTGFLYTGVNCPANVGIGTPTPKWKLEVRGSTYISNYSGIGTQPNPNVQLLIQNAAPSQVGLCVDMPNSNDYNYGYKIRLNNDKVKGFAVNRIDTGEDVFRVYGDGLVEAKRLRLALNVWADYVFEEEYKLMSLSELEAYIQTNHHLPNVPSQIEVQEKGIDVAQMDTILLEKVEELTLYMIAMQKQIDALQLENKALKTAKK